MINEPHTGNSSKILFITVSRQTECAQVGAIFLISKTLHSSELETFEIAPKLPKKGRMKRLLANYAS